MASTVTVIPTSNTEFPLDSDGRVYHIGAKRGEIANRVLLVGDPLRAELIASHWLDKRPDGKPVFQRTSTRGFTWYTGHYNSVPVTVMSIGMGLSMMDFAVREMRALVDDGQLVLIRLGTAGSPNPKCDPGCVVVSTETVRIQQNLSSFNYQSHQSQHPGDELHFYSISQPAPADNVLTQSLISHIGKNAPEAESIHAGISASAESFYSSQGRNDSNFNDHNAQLVDAVLSVHPDLLCFEMETHQLFHLAKISNKPIVASACAIILMQRKKHDIIDHDLKVTLEKNVGKAILETLSNYKIEPSMTLSGPDCVWN